jgi:hypothetical protein
MALTADDIRAMALALEGALEADHHGFPSFRVGGKIFCTLRAEPPRLMVKLGPEDQHNFHEAHPDEIEPVPGYWGRKGATYVRYDHLDRALAETLLRLAWSGVAPKPRRAGRGGASKGVLKTAAS